MQNRIQRDDDDAVKRVLLLFKVRVIYIYDDAQVSQVPGGVERSFFKNVLSFSLSLYFLSSHASRGLRLGREDRL